MADNKNIQKIFSLTDYRRLQLTSKIPERTRETYREYGYYSMGGPFGQIGLTNVYRLDFTNDTNVLNIHNYLNVRRGLAAAAGNSNFGYFGGGGIPSLASSVERIDYANDVATPSFRGSLSLARDRLAAAGNSNFGYFGGGGGPVSTVDRIDYSNDLATATIRGPLSFARQSVGAAFSNSKYGYFTGGSLILFGVPAFSTIDRIDYSNDIVLPSIRGPLSSARRYAAGIGNLNYGYSGGGRNSPANAISLVDRIDYSNDTAQSSPRGNLVQARTNLGATGNSNFAWFMGGFSSMIDRVDYANDTITATSRGRLDRELYGGQATSSHSFGGSPNSSYASNFTFPTVPNAGYFGGGSDGTNNLASIDKVDYANDTATASVRSALSLARFGLGSVGNGNFGYFAGGRVAPTNYSTIDRIEYSSDTQNTIVRGPLSSARPYLGGTGNANFGYFYGSSTPTSVVDRIEYSTDTSTASIRGPLSFSRAFAETSATGNLNFGYFGGGYNPGINVSNIDRVDYANDTMTALARNKLIVSRRRLTATGNNNFGHFAGGTSPLSSIERIDYSNDTATTSFKGPLSLAREGLSSTGNSNFGYFGGGSPGPLSTIDRINYSNDTAIAQVRGPLPVAKRQTAATSPLSYGGAPIYSTNPLPQVFQKQITFNDANTLDLPFKRVLGSYGYFGGGSFPSLYSTVNRIDYSNDTTNASIRGPLSSTRYSHQATGNSNFGYFAGGRISTPAPIVSSNDRIDYSNDLASSVIRGPLASTSYFTNAISSNSFGYFDGFGNISKFDYSNDNATSIQRFVRVRGQSRYGLSGNLNFAYYAGGGITGGSGAVSLIDRLNFSNDSGNSVYRGNLTFNKSEPTSVGNNNFGYVGGARSPSLTTITAVDRIDYSNDTATAIFRFNLDRFRVASTGNQSFGYFAMGGVTEGNSVNSQIYRLNYSNDTSVVVRSNTTYSSWFARGTTNARNS
jgi:hypothetical protein